MPDFWWLEATSQAIIWIALRGRKKSYPAGDGSWNQTRSDWRILIKIKTSITCLQRVWSQNKNGTGTKTIAKTELDYNMKIGNWANVWLVGWLPSSQIGENPPTILEICCMFSLRAVRLLCYSWKRFLWYNYFQKTLTPEFTSKHCLCLICIYYW